MQKRTLYRIMPALFRVAAYGGVIFTAYLSAKATPKAIELLNGEQSKKGKDLSTLEIVRASAPAYIPTAVSAGVTIGCIALSGRMDTALIRNLSAALAATATGYTKYQQEVIHRYGQNVHEEILHSVEKELCCPPPIAAYDMMDGYSLDFPDAANTEVLRTFYDEYSDRYFDSTIEKVLQAEYHLNRNYVLGKTTTPNDFYEFLGLPPIENGDKFGWDWQSGIDWVDFMHKTDSHRDGNALCIEFVFEPSELEYWEELRN